MIVWLTCAKCIDFLLNLGSMLIHLSQTLKAGIKDTKESIGMVLVEIVVMRSLRMGSLVKTVRSSSLFPHLPKALTPMHQQDICIFYNDISGYSFLPYFSCVEFQLTIFFYA